MAKPIARATFEPHTKRLFINARDGRRIATRQMRTRKYADLRAAIATHGLTIDQGWRWMPGGEVYRAVLCAKKDA